MSYHPCQGPPGRYQGWRYFYEGIGKLYVLLIIRILRDSIFTILPKTLGFRTSGHAGFLFLFSTVLSMTCGFTEGPDTLLFKDLGPKSQNKYGR